MLLGSVLTHNLTLKSFKEMFGIIWAQPRVEKSLIVCKSKVYARNIKMSKSLGLHELASRMVES